MEVKKEELLHIANLARLKLQDNEIEKYLLNLQDILNYANLVNKVNVEGLKETVGERDSYNVFRKDELKQGINREELLQNAKAVQEGMFKIPKVIN